MKECRDPDCKKIFRPSERDQEFCSRHCARVFQMRRGIPSEEDTKMLFMSAMSDAYDRIVKRKK